MSAVLERLAVLWTDNPLVAHGPRTHGTGIELTAPVRSVRPRRRPLDVDAPQVHLGHAGRRAA
jgi:hypothetical protein